jgi:hypothetical protein
VNGIRVGLDYSHEKFVNMIQDTTGKIYCLGIHSKIEFASIIGLSHQKDLDIKKLLKALQNGGFLKVVSNRGAILTHCEGCSQAEW